ncbi:MAG TPA: outer membrane beta-barrel protein [Pontibacter sp.]
MKTIFTAVFSLLALCAFGQKHFVKGYYVTAQGDTIQSYINDKKWTRSPDQIQVAASPDGTSSTILTIADLRGFALETGDVFVREIVQLDKSPVSADRMQVGAAPIVVTDTVLLRVLVKGALNLLYMQDEHAKDHFFMQQPGAQPEELLIIRKLVDTSGKTDVAGSSTTEAVRTIEVYKELLARAMHACPEVTEKAYKTDLKASQLTRLFVNYNACVGEEEPGYVAKAEKVKLQPGLVAGLMPTTLTINRREQTYKLTPGNMAQNYTIGLSLNMLLPRARGSWSVYNELAWKAYQAQGSHEQQTSPNNYKHEEITFEMGYLGLNTTIRYQYPHKALQPFLQAGVSNNLSLASKNKVNTYSREFTVEDRSEAPFLDPIRKYEVALLAGVGVQVKQFSMEARYERGNGMSHTIAASSIRHSFMFIVGYSLR